MAEKVSKKTLFEIYKQVKSLLQSKKPLSRKEFLEATDMTSTPIEKEFGTYTAFVLLAEEFCTPKKSQAEKALLSEKQKKFTEEATAEDCIEDLRAIQNEYPEKFISRNFYRAQGSYSEATWNRYFGNFSEFRKQAGLELSRPQQQLEKQIAKHASVDHYRKFYATEVAPWHKKYEKEHIHSRFKRMMIISDVHDIECDEFVIEVFIAECKRKQPDVIVLNGDIFDLYEFSSYKQDPRHIKIKERFDFIHKRLFAPLRGACPDAQIDFIMGNHEFRLIKHIADVSPNLRILMSDVLGLTFSKIFGLDQYQINWVSKFDLAAFTKEDIKKMMKQNHKIYWDAYAVSHEPDETLRKSYSGTNGHHHIDALTPGYNMHRGSTTWMQTPAGHVTDAEYLSKVSKWGSGFGEVVINTETKEVIQYPRRFYESWTEIDGIYYERTT